MTEAGDTKISALSATIALVPSVIPLIGMINFPATHKEMLVLLATGGGLIASGAVLILSNRIQRIKAQKVITAATVLFLASAALLFAWDYEYRSLVREYIVDGEKQTIVLPLIPGEYQRRYARQLGDALENSNVGSSLHEEIESRNTTTPIFLGVLLIVAQIALTTAILIITSKMRPVKQSIVT